MSHQFYCFEKLKYIPQPLSSYWCWAACLSQMVIGLNAPSIIGKKQCQLVDYYKRRKEITAAIYNSYVDCCSENANIPDGCNIPLHENDLRDMWYDSGFHVDEITKLTDLNYFEFIKSILEHCQSPILLKVNRNGNAHMNLITGFGTKNNCEYVLVSDPQRHIGESYLRIDEYINSIHIVKAWQTGLARQNLKPDSLLQNSLNFIDNFLKKYNDAIIQFSRTNGYNTDRLMDRWSYLSFGDPQFVARSVQSLSGSVVSMNSTLTNLLEAIGNQGRLSLDEEVHLNNICAPYFTRDLITLYGVNYIDEDVLNNSSDSDKIRIIARFGDTEGQTAFKEYATRVQLKIEEDIVLVKPISFPNNYKLSREWQSYPDFQYELLKNPKIVYFEEIDSPLPTEQALAF